MEEGDEEEQVGIEEVERWEYGMIGGDGLRVEFLLMSVERNVWDDQEGDLYLVRRQGIVWVIWFDVYVVMIMWIVLGYFVVMYVCFE